VSFFLNLNEYHEKSCHVFDEQRIKEREWVVACPRRCAAPLALEGAGCEVAKQSSNEQ
jgi:hypothetical protein